MTIAAHTKLGRYEILSPIGAGGMGEVYLAEDTRLHRKVALKVLPENIAADKERLLRFEREAQAASALNHPNIITIHEIGETGDQLFIATEYIEGSTLRQKIEKKDLDVYESVRIAEQVAAGLSVAHQAHIIHRDIKPENIMIRRDGYVKILDFGLAKLVEKNPNTLDAEAETRAQVNTKAGMIMGTVAYMSPEQARGKDIDERTDVWSLGVCLYEMLTKRQPFTSETTNDTIAAILTKEAHPLDENLPAELHRIVKKTLQKDADKRYQTAKDLLIDLEEVKEELKFQSKLERTAAPNREETKTQILAATTADVAHTTSSAEYVVGEIKSHKSSFAIGLMVLLVASMGLGYWFFSNRSSNATQIESIAVLPFVNESGNADNEYLSDGMTETLINSLSQLPKLSVKARSSVFHYKGKTVAPQTIGNELSVQAVLNGRVVQRGNNLTLSLELVDTQTGNQIWGEQYNRKQTDLVSLQNEIARDVSNKLRAKLSAADANRIAKNYTTNSEAYQLYLKGRSFLNQGTREGQIKSIEYFQQAVNLDPDFALGYVGMADVYTLLGTTFDASLKPREAMPKARIAAQRALEIEPNLSETHTSLAWIKYRFDWDWRGAEEEFKQAIALNPNNAQAHHWYSDYLVAMGRFDEALAEIKRARELDPFSLLINWNVGRILYFARRYDEALLELRKTLEMDQNFLRTHGFLERVYAAKGMNEEAFAEHLKYDSLTGLDAERITNLKEIYAAAGWKAVWQKEIEWTLEDSKNRYVSPFGMALLYNSRGDKERAIEWLDKAFEDRSGTLVTLKVDPSWDNLRDDPRFQDLLRRVGLTP
jgi:serine/threonine-protein kinase